MGFEWIIMGSPRIMGSFEIMSSFGVWINVLGVIWPLGKVGIVYVRG